jgi:hypothetical protein
MWDRISKWLSRHGAGVVSAPHDAIASDAEWLRAQGRHEAAEILEAISERRNALQRAMHDDVGLLAPWVQILGRGVIAVVMMLVLSLLFIQISTALATAFLFLTVTVLLVFTYAFGVETRIWILNPVALFYSILVTFGLAILVAASLFIT